MNTPVRVTIWNEFRQEQEEPDVQSVYPGGIHLALAQGLAAENVIIRFATLDEPHHGLPEAVLWDTDVLIWWGHRHHHDVDDLVADRVVRIVHKGMGFIALHSAHFSKPFTRLMQTSCSLEHALNGEKEDIRTLLPDHPIARDIPEQFSIEQEEMYGEPFDIPEPDDVIFQASFEQGQHFRAGCTFTCGKGRVFYFQPGHETYPIYRDPNVLAIIRNAIDWARSGS